MSNETKKEDELTIDDFRNDKKKVETDVARLLEDFSRKYKLKHASVDIENNFLFNIGTAKFDVDITVEF